MLQIKDQEEGDPNQDKKLDPDPNQDIKLDPKLLSVGSRPQHWFRCPLANKL